MTLFQKLFPMDGDKSAVQNYGHADQVRGLEAFIILMTGAGLVLLSFAYHIHRMADARRLLLHCLWTPQMHYIRTNTPRRTTLEL